MKKYAVEINGLCPVKIEVEIWAKTPEEALALVKRDPTRASLRKNYPLNPRLIRDKKHQVKDLFTGKVEIKE